VLPGCWLAARAVKELRVDGNSGCGGERRGSC
jgi:hypothetical protein